MGSKRFYRDTLAMEGPGVVTAVFATVVVALIYLARKPRKRPKNFPPGPLGIPFLGSMYYLTDIPHKGMIKLAEKYGNIFSLKFFSHDVVCMTGYEATKILFSTKDICDRPEEFFPTLLKGPHRRGIVEARYGPVWLTNRKLFLSSIRESGPTSKGCLSLEDVIMEQANSMIAEFQNQSESNQPISSSHVVTVTVLNVIATIVFGRTFAYDDQKITKILALNDDVIKSFDVTSMTHNFSGIFPTIAKFWLPKEVHKITAAFNKMTDFFAQEIKAHQESLDPDKPRDFIDRYLIKMQEEEEGSKLLTEHDLIMSLVDIFIVGTESITVAIRWALLFLAGHQDIQSRVHEEIDQVMGVGGEIQYDDRTTMPYTQACIMETQRWLTGGTGLLRVATKDLKIKDYDLPKGTMFLANLYSANFEPNQWKNPLKYDPENYLDEEGNLVPRESFLIWGGGRRVCLGMAIAKQELFLFVAKILQKFKVEPEEKGIKLDYEQTEGLVIEPKQHKLRFTLRM